MKRTPHLSNLLLLALLIICVISLWQAISGDRDQSEPARQMPATGSSRSSSPNHVARQITQSPPEWQQERAEASVQLVILNGTEIDGLARDISLALSLGGIVTQRVGNAPHTNFHQSLLINRRLSRERAHQLSARLGGVQVIEEHDHRTTEDALLILGTDFARIQKALGLGTDP